MRLTRRVGFLAALVLVSVISSGAAPADTATVRFSKRQLFVNPYESTAVGDLNRDGHIGGNRRPPRPTARRCGRST